MKITELIKELNNIKKEHWDLNVAVQYRDGWWYYHWTDEEIELTINKWNELTL